MAKFETSLNTVNFDYAVETITERLKESSISLSTEDYLEYYDNGVRVSVKIFERYSYSGANRLTLTVVFFQGVNKNIILSAVTSGVSCGTFYKVLTLGEKTFLEKLKKAVEGV